jgi:hypothetical protein
MIVTTMTMTMTMRIMHSTCAGRVLQRHVPPCLAAGRRSPRSGRRRRPHVWYAAAPCGMSSVPAAISPSRPASMTARQDSTTGQQVARHTMITTTHVRDSRLAALSPSAVLALGRLLLLLLPPPPACAAFSSPAVGFTPSAASPRSCFLHATLLPEAIPPVAVTERTIVAYCASQPAQAGRVQQPPPRFGVPRKFLRSPAGAVLAGVWRGCWLLAAGRWRWLLSACCCQSPAMPPCHHAIAQQRSQPEHAAGFFLIGTLNPERCLPSLHNFKK